MHYVVHALVSAQPLYGLKLPFSIIMHSTVLAVLFFWDGGWVKRATRLASHRDPVKGMAML